MSWEHDHYPTECRRCGNIGELVISSDDWNRFKSAWEGATNTRIYYIKPQDSVGLCTACGSKDLAVRSRSKSG